MKKMSRFTLSIAMAVMGLFLFGCSSSNSPTDTLKDYLRAYEEKDVETIMELTAADEQVRSELTREDWLKYIVEPGAKELKKREGVDKIEILREEIDEAGEKAAVEHKIIFKNGDEDSSTAKFIKQDGIWKVSLDM